MCRRAICIYNPVESIHICWGARTRCCSAHVTADVLSHQPILYKLRHKHGGMHKVWGNRFHSQSISAGVTFAYVCCIHSSIYTRARWPSARTLSFRLFIVLCLSDPLLARHFCGGNFKWGYREWVVVWCSSKYLCSGCVLCIHIDAHN